MPPMPRDLVRKSKHLSWLLRHGARESGLPMDAAGWCAVDDVLQRTGLARAELEEVVRTNTKGRLELAGDRVRACQGHSPEGTPVTVEALEASWTPWTGVAPVFHGTHRHALEAIARDGLKPLARTHVHLAPSLDSDVGKRSGVGLAIAVDPARCAAAGAPIHEAPNGVLLARHVPVSAFVALHPISQRAQRDADHLRRLLGLGG